MGTSAGWFSSLFVITLKAFDSFPPTWSYKTFQLVLFIFCPRPRIGCFLKKSWLLEVRNVMWRPQSGCWGCSLVQDWSLLLNFLQMTGLGDFIYKDVYMCIYTHLNTFILLHVLWTYEFVSILKFKFVIVVLFNLFCITCIYSFFPRHLDSQGHKGQ